jgi:hypothetical protein
MWKTIAMLWLEDSHCKNEPRHEIITPSHWRVFARSLPPSASRRLCGVGVGDAISMGITQATPRSEAGPSLFGTFYQAELCIQLHVKIMGLIIPLLRK